MSRNILVSFVLFSLFSVSIVCSAMPPMLEYWPTCNTPQNIGPLQSIGGEYVMFRSSIAWNGSGYGVAWIDCWEDCGLRFRKLYADGTPASSTNLLSSLPSDQSPKIVWNGSGYGVVWCADYGTYYQILFLRLDADGNIISGPIKVSFVGITETTHCLYPDLAWNGNGYCVTWVDTRNGNADIFATLLDSAGLPSSFTDIPISAAVNSQYYPRVAWSSGEGGTYHIVWSDYRSGTEWRVFGNILWLDGSTWGDFQITSNPTGYSASMPVLASSGGGMGMTWLDYRDGNYEIYFVRLRDDGGRLGDEIRLTNDLRSSIYPTIVWTGAEYGVFWEDARTGNNDIWFQRVSAAGTLLGGNLQVTYSSGISMVDAAFGRYGYLITGTADANFAMPWGCATDLTPPSCPQNLVAYNITGTTATVAWIPSVEDYTDIAYYEVYRNSNLVALTTNNYYSDSGLSTGTTYNYYVRPVNAAQLVNGTCTNSVYAKTGTSLTLMLDKSDPNAHLYWNDCGLNNYNIFRGTSPQVMSQIGSTSEQSADDANVLLDHNNYFYTVDDPGQ